MRKDHSMNINDLYQLFLSAWSADTAKGEWTPECPSLNHCAVTAVIVQDYFGGDLLRCLCDDGNSHYYNSCPDGEYDLTYSQFAYSNVVPFKDKSEVRTRDYVLSFPDTKIRYEILKERIENAWKEQFSSED